MDCQVTLAALVFILHCKRYPQDGARDSYQPISTTPVFSGKLPRHSTLVSICTCSRTVLKRYQICKPRTSKTSSLHVQVLIHMVETSLIHPVTCNGQVLT